MVAATKPKTIYKAVQISGALTDEAVRNGSIKKVEKKGNTREPSKDKNGRDNNKRTRTGNDFASTANPVGRDNTGVWPKNLTVSACYECGSTDHVRSACPRLNRVQGPEGNRPNQLVSNNEGQGSENQENQARGKAFILGTKEVRQDSNIVTEKVKNVLVNGNRIGCSYKEFLACNPKEYDEEFCPRHEMQKLETELWNHAIVGDGYATYTDRFHELIRGMVAATEPKTIYKAVQISGALTDEAVRNGSIKKVEKKGNTREPSKDKNGRDNNKRTRTGNDFASTANPVGRDNTGVWPKNLTVSACYECGSTDHVRSACPRLNRVQGPEGNRPNQLVSNNEGQGSENQENQARGKAFILGTKEVRQDSNIVTGTFTLNDHFATTLFDSG
nr:hypothetical protein [Tanacetum cinerariifolium]